MTKRTNFFRGKKKSNVTYYFGPFSEKRVAAFHITCKRRNLFFTITDLTGAVIGSVSAKKFAFDRKKRLAIHVSESATHYLALVLRAYRIFAVRLFVKIKPKFLVNAIARSLRAANLRLTFCLSMIPVPHNGCRKKKRRRL